MVGDVSLPGLAIAGSEPGLLRTFYFGYLRYIAMFVLPMGAGLALTAPIFVPLFLSARWNPAIVPTTLISLALGIGALGYVPGVLYKAIGRPDMLNCLALIKMPMAIAILWYATRWNIVGVALAQIAVSLISVSMDMLIANYLLHFPINAMMSALSPALVSTLLMAIAVLLVRNVVASHGAVALALLLLVGVSVYVGVLWVISRESLVGAARAVQQAFRKKARRAVPLESASNDEPRVSAIITAYNSEAFVDDAITSVLRQSRPVDEILVVDDGSTDRTREIAETYRDRGVIYLFQENAGAGAARNLGIQHSKGEFVAFLDADDMWLEDKNRLQMDYLIAHPEVALVSGLSLWWNVAKGTRQQHGKAPANMKTLRREILVRNVIGNPSMCMARRSAILEVGLFDGNTRLCLDFDLWTRIAARFEMAILSSPVIVYRWHQGNLSGKYRWDRFFRTWEISRRAIARSRPAWQRPWLLARAWSSFTHRKAIYAIEHGFPRWQQIAYGGRRVACVSIG